MALYDILDEYENGCVAVRGPTTCFVDIPDGDRVVFEESTRVLYDRRARVYAALYVMLGPIPLLDDRDVIPVKVAAAGKPAMAAYLFANHGGDYYSESERKYEVYQKVGSALGIGGTTVKKYHRRVLRDVQDKRVGGIAR
ncbi:hypothetical protein [Natrinema sp. 1APR25-10V2]|uniref:hypothetical protein n=1 Tax=Natrinema sp. 1APR25-10V2 TaxID=2951081 RepID=UPI0028759362|nr:hypothetical protein [Natrinema sp. 1APR25-10V2]MDS0477920.1 hypothetical protein [Natrinema sp. 1APR25-10V2]